MRSYTKSLLASASMAAIMLGASAGRAADYSLGGGTISYDGPAPTLNTDDYDVEPTGNSVTVNHVAITSTIGTEPLDIVAPATGGVGVVFSGGPSTFTSSAAHSYGLYVSNAGFTNVGDVSLDTSAVSGNLYRGAEKGLIVENDIGGPGGVSVTLGDDVMSATDGDGLYAWSSHSGSDTGVTIKGAAQITGGSNGSGIYAFSDGDTGVIVTGNAVITGNNSSTSGGGIYAEGSGVTTVTTGAATINSASNGIMAYGPTGIITTGAAITAGRYGVYNGADDSGTIHILGGAAIQGRQGAVAISNSFDITVDQGATILANAGGIGAMPYTGNDYDMPGGGGYTAGLYGEGGINGAGTASIVNHGTIGSDGAHYFDTGIATSFDDPAHDAATVTNTGSITAGTAGIFNESRTSPLSVINSGTISAGDYGVTMISNATDATYANLTVVNQKQGVIAATGPSGIGVVNQPSGGIRGTLTLDNSGYIVGQRYGVQGNGWDTITNLGTISTGTYSGGVVDGRGFGITTSGTVVNGASDGSAQAVIEGGVAGLVLANGGTVTNYAGATIRGGTAGLSVSNSFGDATVNNYGTISAIISSGSHPIFLNLYAGSVTGSVKLFVSNDDSVVTLHSGSGGLAGASVASLSGVFSDNIVLTGDGTGAAGRIGLDRVTGFGSITETGSGTWISTAATTYSGPIAINGGTLVASVAGSLGTGTVTVGSGGTLSFGDDTFATPVTLAGGSIAATGSATLSGVLSGAAPLNVSGGTLTLGGTNTYTGATTVRSGTLTIAAAGSISSSSGVTVQSGGTLAGDSAGLPGVTIQPGGTIAPGTAPGALGTLQSGGSLVLESGAITMIDATATAGADRINANGTASIAGTLDVDYAAGDYLATRWIIVSSVMPLTGTYDMVNSTHTPAGYVTSLSYDATHVFLQLVEGFDPNASFSQTGGTIQVNGSQTTGGISGGGGAINTSGGTLTDNQAADSTYSGSLTGDGGFVKAGGGTLVLNGDSSGFTGSTSVTGGTLEVGDAGNPGASLGGNVNVGSGGTLGGHGTVGGSVNNAGTTAPGGSIGVLTVLGNYTFAPGATLAQEAAANGSADLLKVGGAVSIAGNTTLAVQETDPPASYARVTNYTIVTAPGGVSGSFGTVTSSSASLTPIVSYGGNTVNLALVRNDISLATLANTGNQAAVGGAVSARPASALFAAVAPMADASLPATFDSLSGELHASLSTALLYRGGYLNEAAHAGSGAGVHVWGGEQYRTGGFDAAGGAAAASGHFWGFAGGADIGVADGLRLGLAVGTGQQTLTVAARASHARVSGMSFGGYAAYDAGALGLDIAVSRDINNLGTLRVVTIGPAQQTLSADYDANTTAFSGEVHYDMPMGVFTAQPFAGAEAVRLSTDGFAESGGSAALSGAEGERNVIFANLGARLSTAYDFGGGTLRPRLSLAWQHAGDDVAPRQALAFAGGPAFAVSGAVIGGDALAIEAGIGVEMGLFGLDLAYAGRTGGTAHEDGIRLRLDAAL